jgi:hypothetical protein
MLEPPAGQVSKQIFYRGIPLNEYFMRRSKVVEDLEYKDDDTIFFDESQNAIFIEDSFIITERKNPSRPCIPPTKSPVSSDLM